LLNDAFHSTITMHLKLKEEVEIPPTLINLIDDDFRVVLELYFVGGGGVGVFPLFCKEI
jgi:hypothetical protein